jgi:O-antigen ligase/polysaccharide polymerase Wzy-like membrane protein
LLFGLAAGYLAIRQPKLAIALLGAGALIAVFASSPIAIALLAAPVSFDVSRVSLGNGISVSDLILIAATLLSLPALARLGTPRGVTNVRRWLLVYVVAMAVAVAVHPSGRSIIEAGHRTLLVAGALSVGAWIYLDGKTRLALRLLVGTAVVMGAIAVAVGAAHGFNTPAQPFAIQKNYLGSVLGLTMLVLVAAPSEIHLSKKSRYASLTVIGGGLVATQSRAAMLGLVVGVLVCFFRTHSDHRRRSFWAAAVLAIGFLAYAGYLVHSQVSDTSATLNTNSVAVRTKTNAATLALWRTSPIVGVGVYYYNDPKYQEMNPFLVAPTNDIYEALAEGGVVLAVGFVVFQIGAVSVLLRRRNPLAVAGLALVADRLMHGLVDIYWTAGNSSLPWIIAGMGLAQASAMRASWSATRPAHGIRVPPAPGR